MSKLDPLEERILAVKMLKAAHSFYKLSVLADKLGINISVLSRYVNGHVIPRKEQAQYILGKLKDIVDLPELVLEEAKTPNGLIDPTLPLMNKDLLKLITIEFYNRWRDRGVTKVLVPETSGVILAASLAQLLDADVIVARKRKTNPGLKWIEAHISMPPNINRSFYIPYGSVRRNDEVLVVDDFVKSGYTLAATLQLIRKVNANVSGVISLIVFGSSWRRVSGVESVDSIVYIDS